MPVFLQHGISAWSLAEYFFGASKECRNSIQLVIDEHVGAAVITDGSLLHARRNSSAEIGHTRVNPQGKTLLLRQSGVSGNRSWYTSCAGACRGVPDRS